MEESDYSSDEDEDSATENIPLATARSSKSVNKIKWKEDEQFKLIINLFDIIHSFKLII